MTAEVQTADYELLGPELRQEIAKYFPRYPERRAVLLPALHLVQEQLGYIPQQAIAELARFLEIHPAEIADVVSFYSFFRRDRPLGKFRLWVCRSLSCACRGGESLLAYVSQKLGIAPGQTTPDGLFTLEAAECLGACDFAPAIMVNDTLHGPMTFEMVDELLASLRKEAGQSPGV
ncbi:MAG: NADH-quinone oxidoreductase subunit NuoE [Thermoguttaceae bacterium]|nr:NADH-quinone oxidoreductase subunit NuoE [Thermoguttaceae bacterium]MDW8079603.1 NADH-quinone oxidoreductase subunit NuoE [Thermoguttaceae bacterium]